MDAAGGATRAKIRYPEESDNYARKYSEDEASENKNVEWMSDWTAWAFYPTAILTAFCLIILFSSATWVEALTVVHIAHALFTFGALHWVKGSPDFSHISERHLTMWEQIEPGVNWKESPIKKFLMIVPTLLLLATLIASRYSALALITHLPLWGILIIAKLSALDGVRLFGINSTPGIDDDEYDYTLKTETEGRVKKE